MITKVGYGPEDEHFVLELTYNYGMEVITRLAVCAGFNFTSLDVCAANSQSGLGIKSYEIGNDLKFINVNNASTVSKVKELG